ncbi:hypothetical protein [Candidatus Binatus sp.]|uniref:hypothetical protein n=1 Tax=Candidatus Binatus sp. TaxID=2811406 RepID=UPI003CC67383
MNIDRLLMVWLHRLHPSLLKGDHHRPAGDRDPLAPTSVPRLLALEIRRLIPFVACKSSALSGPAQIAL